ncbi:nitrilase-related carbon-nitrogen hydrolase [uncultured Agrococcus sp.]|uniref:nitrilase-related carbon-nitrogen hydrolase n=1 Tax=uncultured Agrococcus sp. TaxID=382258 RepID=UPI002600DD84|nr:nitrilase-related carbon-nitrogen hydrolase [uncultured Agrococcus sp.]
MRIALLQVEAEPLDVNANLETLRAGAEAARDAGAELVLTPELFITGYAPVALRDWLPENDVTSIQQRVAQVAASTETGIVTSYPRRQDDGSITISAGFWAADGRQLLSYDKVHLWGEEERTTFAAADAPAQVVDWRGWNVGLQICYDIEFAEPARHLASRGANLVLVPTAIDSTAHYVPDILIPARAAENGVVVAYADHPASARVAAGGDPVSFAGNSLVASWDGSVLGRAGADSQLLIVELPSPDSVPGPESNYLRDRRGELYAAWAESDLPRRTAP